MAQRILLLNFIMMFCASVGSSQDFWEEIGNPNKGTVWSLALDTEGRIFAATDSGIYRSPDDGITWTRLNVQTVGRWDTGFLSVGPSGDIYASDAGGVGFWHSSDHGESWTHRALELGGATDIVFHTSGNILFKAGNGIYRSTDGGTSWGLVSTIPGVRVEMDPHGDLFALSDSCYRSSDGGATWEGIGYVDDFLSLDTGICGFIITSGGKFVAVTYCLTGDLYTSDDEGVTWVGGKMYGDNHSPVLASNSLGHVFYAGERSVIRSTDGCESWSDFTRGLTDTCAAAFAMSESDYLYAGTKSGRVFRSVVATGVRDALGEGPLGFALNQNYPNPFNPSTTIRFSIPERAHVTLKIFNLVGQEVATLVDERLDAGAKVVEFQGEGLPSGVYFYQLQAGTFSETRKLLLLR